MKKIGLLTLALVLGLTACKNETKPAEENSVATEEKVKEVTKEVVKEEVKSFGKEIVADGALDAIAMLEQYKGLKVGDSLDTKVTAKVLEVCKKKGCWMKLALDNEEEVMVKFKDYGFFMPKDLAGKEVIVNGKAYVKSIPVDEQRHYAEDGGATKEEIAAITEPKNTYSFEADGVLLK